MAIKVPKAIKATVAVKIKIKITDTLALREGLICRKYVLYDRKEKITIEVSETVKLSLTENNGTYSVKNTV